MKRFLNYDVRTRISSHWWKVLGDERSGKHFRRRWALRLMGPCHRRLYGLRSRWVDLHWDGWPMGFPLLFLELFIDIYEDAESGPRLEAYEAMVEAQLAESERIAAEIDRILREAGSRDGR
jgi:hypothetical protein